MDTSGMKTTTMDDSAIDSSAMDSTIDVSSDPSTIETSQDNSATVNDSQNIPKSKNKPYQIKKKTFETSDTNQSISPMRIHLVIVRLMFIAYLAFSAYKFLYKPESKQTLGERIIDFKDSLITPPKSLPDDIPPKQLTIVYCENCKFTKNIDRLVKTVASNLEELEGFKVVKVAYLNAPIWKYLNFMYMAIQIASGIALIYIAEAIQIFESIFRFKLPTFITNGLLFLSEKRMVILVGLYMSGGYVKNFLLDAPVFDAYYGNDLIWAYSESSSPTAGRLVYLIEKIEGIAVF